MAISLPRSRTNIIIAICAVLLIVLGGLALFFFKQYSDLKNNPNVVSQETTQRLIEAVGKIYALPKDEQPTVAEVKDKEKLKEQTFFAKAENSDYILIYTKAKLAVLYREKENKLINVGPIAIDSNNPAQPQPAKATVKVVNGTTKTGRAATVASELAGKLADLVAIDQNYGDAKRKTYTKNLVIDVSKNKADIAGKIAGAMGGEVAELPGGEDKPSADILVIIGK